MTVPTPSAFTGPYFPNGVTTQFPFTFKVNAESEVAVFFVEADGSETLVSPSDYTVELSSNQNNPGGTVTMASAPIASGRAMWIALDPVFTQTTKFEDEGAFNQSILNPTFDAGALRSIWLRSRVLRAISAPFGESGFTLPLAADRANRFLGFGPTGDPLLSFGSGDIDGFRQDVGSADPALGSALIMYLAQGLGSVARLLRSKLSEMRSAGDKGADPTGVADSTVALQNLFADMAATGRVNLLAGTYKVTKPLVIPPGALEGGDVIFDFRDADPEDFKNGGADPVVPCIQVKGGARMKIANLSADLAIGARQMSFAAPHGLAIGDTFNLSGTVDGAGNSARTYYRKGEMFRVAQVVDATTIITTAACRDTYPAADIEVWRRSGDRFTQGAAKLTVLAPDTIMYPLSFENLDGLSFDNVRVTGGAHTAISLIDCYEAKGRGIYARQEVNPYSDAYGVGIFNCQDVHVRGTVYAYFNGFVTGGSEKGTGRAGMNRDIHFEGIAGSHPTGGLAGANFHGNTEDSSFRGYFSNGVTLAGNRNEAHGTFTKSSGFSPVQCVEMHGHEFKITGTIILISGPDLPTNHGAIGENARVGPNLRYGGTTTIDCTLRTPRASRLLVWRPSNLVRTDISLKVTFNIIEGHATTRIIHLTKSAGSNDIPLVEFGALNNIDNAAPVTFSIAAATRIRGLRQRQNVTVAGTGVATATQALTFNQPFPRTPVVNASLASNVVNGTARQTTGLSAVSASGCTVQVSGDGTNMNFNATVAVTASLDE